MAKINTKVLRDAVYSGAENANIRKQARALAAQRVEEAKESMIEELNSHPITKEIESGPDSENDSNTLDGNGNLYSFIGFEAGSKPTEIIRDYLGKSTRLMTGYKYEKNDSGGVYYFTVSVPSSPELEELTPSPWDSKSWTRGIERGISGLGFYIYSKIKALASSRSGTATQSGNKVRSLGYRPVKYMSNIINNFKKKI